MSFIPAGTPKETPGVDSQKTMPVPGAGRVLLPGGLFTWLSAAAGGMILLFLTVPLFEMVSEPTADAMLETVTDKDVLASIWLSLWTSATAGLIAFAFGTPLAYLLARTDFRGKHLVESFIDLPIMIPHPVVGIALLSIAGRDHWIGGIINKLGIEIMGSPTGIVCVLVFVGLPFYINAAKAGFESVPARLENVARSLGAGPASAFFRVTAPLTWRHMLSGIIMCIARAVSEFGAIVIVAYHPMIAPVLMYERFTAYGLKWSQPVAVLLIVVCLVMFFLLRLVSQPRRRAA